MKIHHLLFALTLALVMPISSAFAQKTDSIDVPVKRLMIHLDTHLSTLDKTLRYGSYGLGFDSFLGKHVYLGADMSNQIEALRNNGIHSNYRTTLLGLECGYQWQCKDKSLDDLRFVFSLPLNRNEYRYFLYELGYYSTGNQAFGDFTLGGGIRFFDSRNKNYKDKLGVFLTLGYTIAFDFPKYFINKHKK